jgi:hypothetical protein
LRHACAKRVDELLRAIGATVVDDDDRRRLKIGITMLTMGVIDVASVRVIRLSRATQDIVSRPAIPDGAVVQTALRHVENQRVTVGDFARTSAGSSR